MSSTNKVLPVWAPLATEEEIIKEKARRKRHLYLIHLPISIFLIYISVIDYYALIKIEALFSGVFRSLLCMDTESAIGFRVLMYGALFTPLAVMWLWGVMSKTRKDLKIISIKQNPLPGEKVFSRTEIKRGWRACISPGFSLAIFWLIMPAILIMVVVNIEIMASDIITPQEVAKQCTGKIIKTPENVDHFDQLLKKTQN